MDESFPKTLIEFGYAFNDCQYFLLQSFDYWLCSFDLLIERLHFSFCTPVGQLRKIDPDAKTTGDIPFEFEVMKDNHNYNQRHYEALGEVI